MNNYSARTRYIRVDEEGDYRSFGGYPQTIPSSGLKSHLL